MLVHLKGLVVLVLRVYDLCRSFGPQVVPPRRLAPRGAIQDAFPLPLEADKEVSFSGDLRPLLTLL